MRIGNSQGVRLPKSLIEQAGLSGEVEITVEESSLVIKSVARHRAGWADAFREMAKHNDDTLIGRGSSISTEWDKSEWVW